MLISELSRRSGVSRHTIRYYDRFGLLEPHARLANNYRDYSESDLVRIQFIDRVKRIGFSLKEIREFLAVFADTSSDPGAAANLIRERLENKRAEVERKQAELTVMGMALDAMLASCDAKPHRTKNSLERLVDLIDQDRASVETSPKSQNRRRVRIAAAR